MPAKPLFEIGDKALHVAKGKVGKIVDRFFDGQEQRYYIIHSGWTWSVPEAGLDSAKYLSRYQEKQDVTEH